MNNVATLDPAADAAKWKHVSRWLGWVIALPLLLGGVTTPARAVDGCLVMLCFAAPSWRAIPRCVPPIRQVLRDLARGKAFPTCAMAGVGNSARNDWANAPRYCPPQYTHLYFGDADPVPYCDYTGAVSVSVNGALFSRTWWNVDGGSVTEFTPAAKKQLGGLNTQFDIDYANWLSAPPPVAAMDSNP